MKRNDYFQRLQSGTEIVLDARFSMLLSLKRNEFFEHLDPFLSYYSNYNVHLKKQYSDNPVALTLLQALPDIEYRNYSLTPFLLLIMLLLLPITFVAFLVQWSYIQRVKQQLRDAMIIYHELATL